MNMIERSNIRDERWLFDHSCMPNHSTPSKTYYVIHQDHQTQNATIPQIEGWPSCLTGTYFGFLNLLQKSIKHFQNGLLILKLIALKQLFNNSILFLNVSNYGFKAKI